MAIRERKQAQFARPNSLYIVRQAVKRARVAMPRVIEWFDVVVVELGRSCEDNSLQDPVLSCVRQVMWPAVWPNKSVVKEMGVTSNLSWASWRRSLRIN